MENTYRIYKITNRLNNKIYIGQTKREIFKRFSDHMSHAIKSKRPNDLNCALYIAVREDKPENFSVELLEEFTGTRHQADKKEIEWIAKLNSTNPEIGYNTDKGGHVISEKCREARRQQLLGSKLTGSQLEIVRENGTKIAKAVYQYDPKTGELIGEYPSIIGASRSTGCDRRTIQRQLSGESNTGSAHSLGNLKYIWRYKE
jgi:hypothetical protein